MGVSGSGKTTVAAGLAQRLGVPLAEADEFHSPANIAKMTSGRPLDDADRAPWLAAIAGWIAERARDGGGVVTCSALKRRYRDTLLAAAPGHVLFLHLDGDKELLAERIGRRSGHFMPPALLDSQLADLEPLEPGEPGVRLDIALTPDALVDAAAAAVEGDR
ncbi:gluconokinase [Actinokineospora bangkokensis]|uniref:Gluconokinase n=1 Tax=Actinokineospora bangkokensis TaxID=1193682 RepID=A0A1Q9LEC6_9PSEU|nr:gluconokinase [Actinokineospora bangkokensis]OLR90349.1 gluconokinase [Actinokineospora bangkokensis]